MLSAIKISDSIQDSLLSGISLNLLSTIFIYTDKPQAEKILHTCLNLYGKSGSRFNHVFLLQNYSVLDPSKIDELTSAKDDLTKRQTKVSKLIQNLFIK